MTPTEQFIRVLTGLKSGDLGMLRTYAGNSLEKSVSGFDLFTGLWWPLRHKNQRAPRREVAWLVAKLYAFCPIQQSDYTFASQLGRCRIPQSRNKDRLPQKFDDLLMQRLDNLEPALRWGLDLIARNDLDVDWVKLTEDLSIWGRESTRLRWANEFLTTFEGGE